MRVAGLVQSRVFHLEGTNHMTGTVTVSGEQAIALDSCVGTVLGAQSNFDVSSVPRTVALELVPNVQKNTVGLQGKLSQPGPMHAPVPDPGPGLFSCVGPHLVCRVVGPSHSTLKQSPVIMTCQ